MGLFYEPKVWWNAYFICEGGLDLIFRATNKKIERKRKEQKEAEKKNK